MSLLHESPFAQGYKVVNYFVVITNNNVVSRLIVVINNFSCVTL